MKYCAGCKLSVTGDSMRCPLCQGRLSGNASPAAFPPLETHHARKILLRIFLFVSIAVVLLCVFINLIAPTNVFWSFFVLAGVACLWLSVGVAIHKRRDPLKNICWQAFIISLLSIIWDIFTRWRGWSVNFVVPCVFLTTMLLTPLLAKILRLSHSAYMVYFCIVFGFGLIPAVFLFTGLVTTVIPSLLCLCVSALSLIGLVVFGGKEIAEELRRRFHI